MHYILLFQGATTLQPEVILGVDDSILEDDVLHVEADAGSGPVYESVDALVVWSTFTPCCLVAVTVS